jgi:hypothetical protein
LQAARVLGYRWGLYDYGFLLARVVGPANSAEAGDALVSIGEPVVPELIRSYKGSPDPRVKERIVWQFRSLGPRAREALPLLLEELGRAEDEVLKLAMLNALGKIARREPLLDQVIAALQEHRKSGNQFHRRSAVLSLARIDLALVQPRELVEMLDAVNVYDYARSAGDLLVAMGERAAPALVEVLGEQAENRRRTAAWLLPRIAPTDKKVQKDLAAFLGDTDEQVRWRVAVALGLGGYSDDRTLAVLGEYHEKGSPLLEGEPDARAALRRIGKPAVHAMLDLALRLSKSKDEVDAGRATELMWDVKTIGPDDPAIVPKLLEIIGDGNDVRSRRVPAAVEIIGVLGEKGASAVPRLKALIKEQARHRGIVEAAAQALKKIEEAQQKARSGSQSRQE